MTIESVCVECGQDTSGNEDNGSVNESGFICAKCTMADSNSLNCLDNPDISKFADCEHCGDTFNIDELWVDGPEQICSFCADSFTL